MEPAETDLFCISAVPPFAFAHARTLSRLLQGKFPHTKIVVGVWGFTGDAERAMQRFQPAHPERLAGTLADALQFFTGSSPAPTPPADIPEATAKVNARSALS
jgi:hypothetical protein